MKRNTRSLRLLCSCLLPLFCLSSCAGHTGGASENPSSSAAGASSAAPLSAAVSQTVSSASVQSSAAASSAAASQTLEQRVQAKLAGMTEQQKIAQLFVIKPEALTGVSPVTVAGEATRSALRANPVGGLVYFGANVVSPAQLTAMTANTQKYAQEAEGMPLLLSIDEEGGSVARIGNNANFNVKQYANMRSVGATGDPANALEVGDTIGSYLHRYGLNLDFAPDADVLTNPANTVIGDRSFGTDASLVAQMDVQEAQGLTKRGVLPCFKHFPGHGATQGDTHEGFASTDRTLEQLTQSELLPFRAAADHRIPFVMVSHISVPKVIGDNTPSSLSKTMITDILRKKLGYSGIIITDSMSMGAITNSYTSAQAAVKALQAGADMILMPQDYHAAFTGVQQALASGALTEEQLNRSLQRILTVKLQLQA